ncbi:hypothetical protein Ancab_011395 [Ancistrocladus abbreviatus]
MKRGSDVLYVPRRRKRRRLMEKLPAIELRGKTLTPASEREMVERRENEEDGRTNGSNYQHRWVDAKHHFTPWLSLASCDLTPLAPQSGGDNNVKGGGDGNSKGSRI